MEYLEGGDFRKAVLSEKLSRQEILRAILSVGEALQYAHDKHCIHRDVKPHNILLDANKTFRLTDFDLVYMSDSTGGTRTGALGTFLYSPPEILQVAKEADVRSDVYSLGMTAAFGFYGKDLPLEVLVSRKAFFKNLPCPYSLRMILERATDPEKPKRYNTVAEFCAELNGINLDAPTTHTKKRPPPYPTKEQILTALERFDKNHRNSSHWLDWDKKGYYKFAIEYRNQRYPIKQILSLASDIHTSEFSGGPIANERISRHGFNVIELRAEVTGSSEPVEDQ